MKIKETRKK